MLRVLSVALALHACGGPAGAQQLVTVVVPAYRTTHATVALWRRAGRCRVRTAGPWPARVGRNGLSDRRREGDGTTPTGTYAFGRVVYGLGSDPGARYPYHRLVCGDWWDEDPASPTYNTFRHVACGARPPFGAARRRCGARRSRTGTSRCSSTTRRPSSRAAAPGCSCTRTPAGRRTAA